MTILPSLQLRPISTSHYYLSGDVVIGAGVAIAPGVLIQADPDTRVIIHSGVVIGSGTVIHSHHGDLEIGTGTIIGAEVLLVGALQIGEQACIGAASTLFHRPALVGKAALQIAAGEFVPSGSLIGDRSRSVAPETPSNGSTAIPAPPPASPPEPTATTPITSPSSGFSATATHGFIGVPPTATGEPVSYFQAPELPKPDLPHQPFTEHPPTPIGTPPPPTSVSPQPSYPQPYTMPKADIPPLTPPPPPSPPDGTASAIEPITNGAGTVNYVNQMLGRMFPHRQTQI